MAGIHSSLVQKAKDVLRERGFGEDEIIPEFKFKKYKIDVVGWKKSGVKVAVECGNVSLSKLEELQNYFDEVIHIPHSTYVLDLPKSRRVESGSFLTLSREDAGLKRIVDYVYGNHPKRQLLKAKGAIVIKFLREGPKTLSELAVRLGLDLKKPAELSQFYAALRPLRETGMISTHRSQGKTFYALSYASFRFALEQLRKDAEYWLKEEGT